MRGRLGAYALWQARDFAFERGFPMMVVSTIILFPVIMLLRTMRRDAAAAPQFGELSLAALVQALPLLSFVLVILAVNGIVSNDRKRGYYRFLFAKPVSLVGYYVQSFLVSGAGLLLVGTVILLGFYLLAAPALPWGALAFFAVQFIGLGGLIFLLSTIVRADWIFIAGIWLATNILRALYPPHESWYGRVFHYVLPPTHLVDGLARDLSGGADVSAGALAWVLGYGLAAFAIGVVMLTRRPLGS